MLQVALGEAPGRNQHVGAAQRARHVAHREARSGEARRVGDHLDLARVTRKYFDLSHAGHAREGRTHDIKGIVAQVGRGQAAGQVQREERKRRGH